MSKLEERIKELEKENSNLIVVSQSLMDSLSNMMIWQAENIACWSNPPFDEAYKLLQTLAGTGMIKIKYGRI